LIFKTKTKSLLTQAELYTELLVVSERGSRNIEAMSANLSSNDYHRIQHFISESPWSARELIDSVALDVNELFKTNKSVGLLIDESSEEKKGDCSVGVAHQYCGNLGKLANCQVAVFATLCSEEHFSIIDAELYLPESWINDTERREKAGVPENIEYKKKAEIALEIIKRIKDAGVRFDYVAADSLYGHDSDFRAGLDELEILYIVDTHKDTKIYKEEFKLEVPLKKPGTRGKTPSIERPNKQSLRVDKYVEELTASDWEKVTLRNGSKGALISQVHGKEIYIEENGVCKKRILVIRKTKEHKSERIHYIISNQSLDKFTVAKLAEYQCTRFYIEQSFREVKQNIGMCEYQVRGWLAWNHHIALIIMALAFFTMEKINNKTKMPLLSYRDIRDMIIANYLEEIEPLPVEEKIARRHQKRQKDINRHYENQE
jgi:SRSO17 transposase